VCTPCLLQSDAANEVLVVVRQVAQEVLPSVYDPRTGKVCTTIHGP
jgi:hypothetical protein